MAAKKEPLEKLKTKIKKIATGLIKDNKGKISVKGSLLFTYNKTSVKYTQNRYFPTQVNSIVTDDFEVTIPLSHINLKYITVTNANPPKFARAIVRLFRDLGKDIHSITIGAAKNEIVNGVLNITYDVYDDFAKINAEEGRDKAARFKNRVNPYLNKNFGIKTKKTDTDRDYGLLLKEVINSGRITQQDIISLTASLEKGNSSNIVIEKQINKQVEWLIESIESILDEEELNKNKAQDLGNKLFGFTKTSISGAEQLMEMILTKYGQYTLFGVPALLNTNKYVQHADGLSRSQFDLLLVNHIGEIEVVELKRPDKNILDFDPGRNKFYPSKDLSIAISQAERYISSVLKDNDEEFIIDGMKIREFLKKELGGVLFIETVRPSALIVMGSYQHIYEKHENLDAAIQKKVPKAAYNKNGDRAFRELKSTFRNINILTYSELLEHARTRLQLAKK